MSDFGYQQRQGQQNQGKGHPANPQAMQGLNARLGQMMRPQQSMHNPNPFKGHSPIQSQPLQRGSAMKGNPNAPGVAESMLHHLMQRRGFKG